MTDQWAAEPVNLIGWTLLHFLWQGTVASLLLAFVLLVVPRHWARLRYLCACAALAGMAAAPVLTLIGLRSGDFAPIALTTTAEPALTLGVTAGPPAGTAANGAPTIAAPAVWLPWFVGAWALGVLVCAARLIGGWWQARRLLHDGVTEPAQEWTDIVDRLARRLQMHRPVRLLESVRVQVPLVIGSLRPVLLLPAAALTGLTAQQVEAVLAHEIAHIRRYDYLVNLLQSAVETVLFYHPAVWWVSHTIRVEREHCCDDLAVKACGDVLLYAKALTTLETLRRDRVGVAMAASSGSLLSRVRRLVGHRAPAPVAASGWVVAAATVLMVAGAGASGWLPNPGTWVPITPSSDAVAMAAVTSAGSDRRSDDVTQPEPAPAPAPSAADPSASAQPRPAPRREHEDAMERALEGLERTIESTVEAAMSGIESTLERVLEDPKLEAVIAQAVEQSLAEAERGLREAGPEIAELTRETVRETMREAEQSLRELRRELKKEAATSRRPRDLAANQARERRMRERTRDVQQRARALAADAARLGAEAARLQEAMKHALPAERVREIQDLARRLSEHAREFAAEARRAHQAGRELKAVPAPPAAPAAPPTPAVPGVVPAPPAPATPPSPPPPERSGSTPRNVPPPALAPQPAPAPPAPPVARPPRPDTPAAPAPPPEPEWNRSSRAPVGGRAVAVSLAACDKVRPVTIRIRAERSSRRVRPGVSLTVLPRVS